MAAAVGKYAANKLLSKEMKKYVNKGVTGDNDPYFMYIDDPHYPNRKPKKVKKLAPAYIPEHDANILNAFRRRAYRLDVGLCNFLGIRFGYEALIGLIPIIGDFIGVAFALLLVKQAMKVEGGLNSTILMRMMINIAIDFAVGLVPFVGDLADAAFKCNTKNLRLLERHLDKKYRPDSARPDPRGLTDSERKRRTLNRKSGIYHPEDLPPATAYQSFDDDIEEEIPHHAAGGRVAQPAPAATSQGRGGGRGGWFSGAGSRRDPQPDVEMAQSYRQGGQGSRNARR